MLSIFMRSRVMCLYVCFGILVVLTACTGTAAKQSEASVKPSSYSQNSTPTVLPVTPGASVQATGQPSSTPTATSQSTTKSTRAATPTVIVPSPTPVVTALPTPMPTPSTDEVLTLTLACSSPNAQDGLIVTGSHAKACVYVSPGASMTIAVSFCGSSDPSSALQGTFVAGASGFYEWNWTPQASCNPITYGGVTVRAQLNGQMATVSHFSKLS